MLVHANRHNAVSPEGRFAQSPRALSNMVSRSLQLGRNDPKFNPREPRGTPGTLAAGAVLYYIYLPKDVISTRKLYPALHYSTILLLMRQA